jgi:hypothetical protein
MRLIFKIYQFEAGKMAPEIFRFTVIRPIKKQASQGNKNFTVLYMHSSINLENRVPQGCRNIEPLWEEELYIMIGQIKRFHYGEILKGRINRTRAIKTMG